jgi:hypothetical protein
MNKQEKTTKRILRVFPRRTHATPDDDLVFISGLRWPAPPVDVDEVHISVTFTFDLPKVERLVSMFTPIAPVKVGGPATGERGGDFEPGMYIKRGYVITSRGCPNRCWFCSVPKREGNIRELPIREGWNVLDDNLLACSDRHVLDVFKMLSGTKKENRIEFTGGLEAARLQDWHVEWLNLLRPKQMFFAYDTDDDYEPLVRAGKMLKEAGLCANSMRCYVLIGYPRDTFDAAKKRLIATANAGFIPAAMLYRNLYGNVERRWSQFQREWFRVPLIKKNLENNLEQATP